MNTAKEMNVLFTFNTTTDAIAAEFSCKKAEVPSRLIPLPSVISAGCGMCLKCKPENRENVISVLTENSIEHSGIYQMLI